MMGSTPRIDTRAGWRLAAAFALVVQLAPHSAVARPAAITPSTDASDDGDALPYVECVPFARQASGIQLFGDAHTWWDQADGQYARGHVPAPGAVMSFRPYGAMRLGHVAMVSKVIDTRTVLLRHSNWSPIGGRRGQAELDVRAVDVSDANDWSEVRVWYAPIGDLGTTRWPVNGFIYKRGFKQGPGRNEPPLLSARTTFAQADAPRVTRLVAMRPAPATARPTSLIDSDFLDGIQAEAGATAPRKTRAVAHAPVQTAATRPTRNYLFARVTPARTMTLAQSSDEQDSVPVSVAPALRDDPIGRIIAQRMAVASR